jgi:hypothetical protein
LGPLAWCRCRFGSAGVRPRCGLGFRLAFALASAAIADYKARAAYDLDASIVLGAIAMLALKRADSTGFGTHHAERIKAGDSSLDV